MANASIGMVGALYADPANVRTKGFVPRVFEDAVGVQGFLEEAVLSIDSTSTRVTIRVFVPTSVGETELDRISIPIDGWDAVLQLEAYVPDQSRTLAIAYFGANIGSRVATQEVAEAVTMNMANLGWLDGRSPRTLADGFELQVSAPSKNGLSMVDVERLCDIYSHAFTSYLVDLDDAELISGMCTGNLVIVVRSDEGEIVSVAMAELAEIELDNGATVTVAEISEVATHVDFRGRGFARVLYLQIVDQLAAAGVDFVYTEARGNHAPICMAAAKAGMRVRGVLSQHCVIGSTASDVPDESRFGDLVVLGV